METIIIGVLLLASVIGLTFIIERGLALRVAKVIPPTVLSAVEACRTADDLPMLRNMCRQHPAPLSRLLLLADQNRHWPLEDNANALETNARQEVSRLERGLVILEIVVGVAPLLGLVGTIYGLIILFAGMGGATALGESSALTQGIALALRATLLGLITAIPSLVAWNYYNRKVESMAIEMAAVCDTFLHQLYHGEEAARLAETPAARRA
jgi:biopolymer transport protein ExbB